MALRSLVQLLIVLILLPAAAQAHRTNESYVYFNVSDDALTGRFEATLKDIDAAIGIDSDRDGSVSEAEFLEHGDRIFALFADRLILTHDGRALDIQSTDFRVLGTPIGAFGLVGFSVEGLGQVPEALNLQYRPLADVLGAGHAGFVLIESNTRTGTADNEAYISLTFETGDGPKTLSLVGEPWHKVLVDFVIHGIWHIWLGFDHVVFLVTLLLPAVMFVAAGRWEPLGDFRTALWNVLKIVTVFTLSHSVTLTLAALGVVQLPVPLVEAIIALSIIAVALMNMFPNTHRYVLATVFVFGLFHGFGFANVLAPLGIDPSRRILGIAAFNIGVEVGQIGIVLAAFPLLWVMRRWSLYPPLAFRVGSVALILLAGVWFLERSTGFEWNTRATIKTLTGISL